MCLTVHGIILRWIQLNNISCFCLLLLISRRQTWEKKSLGTEFIFDGISYLFDGVFTNISTGGIIEYIFVDYMSIVSGHECRGTIAG